MALNVGLLALGARGQRLEARAIEAQPVAISASGSTGELALDPHQQALELDQRAGGECRQPAVGFRRPSFSPVQPARP